MKQNKYTIGWIYNVFKLNLHYLDEAVIRREGR